MMRLVAVEMANPEQQGLKLEKAQEEVSGDLVEMANPEQQGLKLYNIITIEANVGLVEMANPEQQGLKLVIELLATFTRQRRNG